jgi:SAM-dependent methyltransferase
VQLLDEEGRCGLPDGSADRAVCFEVLEHLMEPERALREISRVLTPGGLALLSVPNAGFVATRAEFALTGFLNPGGSPLTARRSPWCDPHIRFFNRATLRRLVESCGLEVVEERAARFTLADLPYVYRHAALSRFANRASAPVGRLSTLLPGVFGPRLFVVARRPAATD